MCDWKTEQAMKGNAVHIKTISKEGFSWCFIKQDSSEMLYVDDLVICPDDEKSLQDNVGKWQSCMERRGLHAK